MEVALGEGDILDNELWKPMGSMLLIKLFEVFLFYANSDV